MMKILDKGVWKPFEDSAQKKVSDFSETVERPEKNRYHLYVSYACPWAHRVIIYRNLKGLQDYISISVLDPRWGTENGWYFKSIKNSQSTDETTNDHVLDKDFLWEIYAEAHPSYVGKVTVPVLYDKKENKIISNESTSIIHLLDKHFPSKMQSLRPEEFDDSIETINKLVLSDISMKIYQAGFARNQKDYEYYTIELFQALEKANKKLKGKKFLITDRILESDIHLFCALIRFDLVYTSALRLNLKSLEDFEHLKAFVVRVLNTPKIKETFKPIHIKAHYFDYIEDINPRIIPLGPNLKYLTLIKEEKNEEF